MVYDRYGEEVKNYLDVYLQTPGLLKEDVAKALLVRSNGSHFSIEPAWQRAPPEIWEQIATHTPKYHLRAWLFLSRFHWDIASRHIFHTIHINFGGYRKDVCRGLDILDHAKGDPIFASRVKSLCFHWEGNWDEMLALLIRMWL